MSTQVGVDRAKIRAAIENVTGQIADMIRDLPDTSIKIPRMNWTVGEAAAHISDAQGFFARLVAGELLRHGDGTPGSLAAANKALLAANPQREGAALALSLTDNTQAFLSTALSLPASRSFMTPMGEMDAETMLTYSFSHCLQHGLQIGRGVGKPLKFDNEMATLTLPFLKNALPKVLDTKAAGNLNACYQVMMRGGPTFWVSIDHGTASIHDSKPRRVDCFISAAPAAFIKVGFRHVSQWPMIAQGKLLAWGIKPWLGFRFAGLFLPP